jgi:hypothetical protein
MIGQPDVNRFVLDSIRNGPVELDGLYKSAFGWQRVPRGMVDGALMHFKAKRLKDADTGTRYAEAPDNLCAIWWARRRPSMSSRAETPHDRALSDGGESDLYSFMHTAGPDIKHHKSILF